MAKQIFTILMVFGAVFGVFLAPVPAFANHTCSPPYSVASHENGVGVCRAPADGGDADGGGTITTFAGLIGRMNQVLGTIVPFIIGLAILVIIWGVFKYIADAGSEEKRAEARLFVVWGIVGVFIMVSIWGFVNILVNTFSLSSNIDGSKIPRVPEIQQADGGSLNDKEGGSLNDRRIGS